MTENLQESIETLIAEGERQGCVNLSRFNEFAAEHELDDEDVRGLYEQLDERGVEVSDDCGRETEQTDVRERRPRGRDDGCLAALPQRGRPLAAADSAGGGRAREADRARRHGGEGTDDQLQPPPGRVDRKALPGPWPLAARPDPGRDHRAHPGGREVRLAQGVQVLDVRHLVDPPGRAARGREQVTHDPDPGPHRRARAADRPRGARAHSEARPPADRGGGRQARRSCR